MVARGHVESNPLDLIAHPKVDEKVVPIVTIEEKENLLRLTDPKLAKAPKARFLAYRDRAVLMLLIDTPGRRSEITDMTLDGIDFDEARFPGTGKGDKQRWMPLGSRAADALWDYIQLRETVAKGFVRDMWVSSQG